MKNNNEEFDKLTAQLMDKMVGLLVFHGAHGIALTSGDRRTKYIQTQLLSQAGDIHDIIGKYIEMVHAMINDTNKVEK
jgi:hypothetical protein